jgi:hypothetical protein
MPPSFLEATSVHAEYVTEEGMPTGEALVCITDLEGRTNRYLLSADDAERLGDLLVQISSARPKASADNMPLEEGAGI